MTATATLSLFTAMLILAALPGPGVLVVVSRSLDRGWHSGLRAVAGIVTGDYIFICLAVLGLSTLANTMGNLFAVVQYLGAAYLLWLGASLLLAPKNVPTDITVQRRWHSTDYLAGLLTTLANPKAILFYVSFFPAFLDLTQVSATDIVIVLSIATVAVGSVMSAYAFLAVQAKTVLRSSSQTAFLRYGSAACLITGGIFVALRA